MTSAPVTAPAWRCAYCRRCPPYVRRTGSAAHICRACRDDLAARGRRWCSSCAAPRPAAAFSVGKGRCRPCVAAQQRESGHAHQARYRDRHRPIVRERDRLRMRQMRAADPSYARRLYQRQRLAHARRLLRLLADHTPRP